MTDTGLELRSKVTSAGELVLSLKRVPAPVPGPEEVVVRMEAAPINPSDLGLLLAGADLAEGRTGGTADEPVLTARVPKGWMAAMGPRLDKELTVGNEGAGTVIAAGASDAAQALLGRVVSVIGGTTYTQFRLTRPGECYAFPDGTRPADAASVFVNPLTALGMTETMRREGHTALVHTAAASNLGQMLNRICLKDGIGLVNIVRSKAQAETLRAQGAAHVVDSTAAGFMDALTQALADTGATIAFDAIGGGRLAGQILTAMEAAVNRGATEYSRYGSTTHKQVYIYGGLDTGPTEFTRSFGLYWSIGGWLLTPFLAELGSEDVARLRARVAAELTTTFASRYTAEISLAEALQPDVARAYDRRATGEKYLINPAKAAT